MDIDAHSLTEVKPFLFEGAPIRVVEIDGKPWFVGKDVAERLGYADTTNAMKQHCKGVVKRHPLLTAGGVQEARILSEPDVLRLIVSSNLPAAERFERWVFEDVLPAIRKTGGFQLQPAFQIPQTLPEALRLAAEAIEQNKKLEVQLAEQAPKVAAHERLQDAEGTLNLREAAKAVEIPERKFIQALHSKAWIFKPHGGKEWLGYADKTKAGLLTHKVTPVRREDGSEKLVEKVRITPKGITKLAEMFHAGAGA